MIPLRDVIPTRTIPIVTIALMAAQAVAAAGLALPPALVYAAANAVCVWVFGNTVEDRMGHIRFVLFCALCGASAVAVQTIVEGRLPFALVAASGLVGGIVGAYFVLYPASRVVALVPLPFYLQVVEVPAVFIPCAWFLVQFASGAGIPAATGLAAGAASVLLFRQPERMRVEWWDDRRRP